MKRIVLALGMLLLIPPLVLQADVFIVENGLPRAEIVIAEKPQARCGSRRGVAELCPEDHGDEVAHRDSTDRTVGKALLLGVVRTRTSSASGRGLKDGATASFRVVTGWCSWATTPTSRPSSRGPEQYRRRQRQIAGEWEKITHGACPMAACISTAASCPATSACRRSPGRR